MPSRPPGRCFCGRLPAISVLLPIFALAARLFSLTGFSQLDPGRGFVVAAFAIHTKAAKHR